MNGLHLPHNVTNPRYHPFTSGACYPWSNLFGTVGNTAAVSMLCVCTCVVLCCVV